MKGGNLVEFGIVVLDINGRVRIPAELRNKFGWKRGQRFKVKVDEGKKVVVLIPVEKVTLRVKTEEGEFEVDLEE